ncbi:MAG: hydroxymethylglutaryl-CoA lyase [Desulfococcaceae bacterium]
MPKSPFHLVEVGPRDGFQMESRAVPTGLKAVIVETLVAAGLREIQIAAFVHPRRVPQMADAEDLVGRLPRDPDVRYTGLALNVRGVERAAASGLSAVEVSISASDAHGRRNAGMDRESALGTGREMARRARELGLEVVASVQCAFGCVYQGAVPLDHVNAAAEVFLAEGVERLTLADTTGMATPPEVEARIEAVREIAGGTPLGLHLHDTRGLGLVNAMAGLKAGVAALDTAFGGLGGCPFVPGAAGNIPTEETVYLLESLGLETGVDRERVADCSRRMADFFGRPLAGRLYRLADAGQEGEEQTLVG